MRLQTFAKYIRVKYASEELAQSIKQKLVHQINNAFKESLDFCIDASKHEKAIENFHSFLSMEEFQNRFIATYCEALADSSESIGDDNWEDAADKASMTIHSAVEDTIKEVNKNFVERFHMSFSNYFDIYEFSELMLRQSSGQKSEFDYDGEKAPKGYSFL